MTGLFVWLVIGCLVGALHRWLPGNRPSWSTALAGGALGALLGGLLATVLGIGGLAVFDPRSAIVAFLAALIILNGQRFFLARRR